MGTLRNFNLASVMELFGTRTLVETGTGDGDGLAYARLFAFDRIASSEISPALAETARARVGADPRVTITCGTSEGALSELLPTLPQAAPILFWLDAHFPGADYGLADYRAEPDARLRLPLAIELDTIARHRPNSRDVIIADDLRIYENGPFAMGNIPPEANTLPPEHRNIDFVTRGPWAATHNIRRMYDHTGYLILTPRAVSVQSERLAA